MYLSKVFEGNLEMEKAFIEGNTEVNSEVGIVLPTYCEAENIGQLIREIENLNLNLCILVIDDASKDGTVDIVRELQNEYDNILLYMRGGKYGLGTAITDAFKIFLSLKHSPKYIVTMDADYSHNPKDIPELLSNIKSNHVIIGSRYSKNGKVIGWSPIRKLVSRFANIVARFCVGAKLNDCTSGFRCYSTDYVSSIVDKLHSETYEIQIETLRQGIKKNYKVAEQPIKFVNREKGKSKLSLNEIKDFVFYIIKANAENFKELIKNSSEIKFVRHEGYVIHSIDYVL